MSTVPKLKTCYLYTDVGDSGIVTALAAIAVMALNMPNNKENQEKFTITVHITNPAKVPKILMNIFNKAQVRFGALDNLLQMRDVVVNKENHFNFNTIN